LAEVSRQNGAALAALAAARARAGVVIVGARAGVPQDNADVQIARALHLAEVARQNNNALVALAAAQGRLGGQVIGISGLGKIIG